MICSTSENAEYWWALQVGFALLGLPTRSGPEEIDGGISEAMCDDREEVLKRVAKARE